MKRLIIAAVIFVMASVSMAQDFKIVGAEELKKMMDSKKKVLIVDARPVQEYSMGHIPNAINIAPEQVASIGSLLPPGKKTPIVFYCRGVG